MGCPWEGLGALRKLDRRQGFGVLGGWDGKRELGTWDWTHPGVSFDLPVEAGPCTGSCHLPPVSGLREICSLPPPGVPPPIGEGSA